MPTPPHPARASVRRNAAPALAMAIGLLATAAAWRYVGAVVAEHQGTRFREVVSASTAAVRERMEAYTAILRAVRGLFAATGEPSRAQFAGFVASLQLERHYPGIQGIGWSKWIPARELAAHEAEVRRSGDAGYRVWPEGPRDAYTSIVYLEPLDWRNLRAIGYDMFSEPTRREAMERARDTGDVAASGPVELVQEAGEVRQTGFLMYLPVYERRPASPAERPLLLRGWVYAPFRSADLLRGILDPEDLASIALAVYDGTEVRPQALLYDAGSAGAAHRVLEDRVEVGGRTWTLVYTAGVGFVAAGDRLLPAAVLAAGLLLTLFLVWLTLRETRARARAEESARRSAFLAEAGKVLASSLEYAETLASVANLAARWICDAAAVYVDEPGGPLWIGGYHDPEVVRRGVEAVRISGLDLEGHLGPEAALRTRRAQVVPRIDPRHLPFAERAPALAAVWREVGARSSLTVPLVARDQGLGAISLFSRRRGRFGPEDVVLAEDLARLVAAAIDTARLYRQAQEAIRERDEFLSIASHELKTPLTSLALQSDSLRASARRGQTDAVATKVDVVRRNVERLSRLVASLLDVSSIRAGRLELELEAVDLSELARDVVERFEDEARRAGCTIALSAERPVVGRWDRLRLDQVLTNLLSNAVKYGPGKPIDVAVEERDARALLTVRDRGIGISEADRERIFERFERAVSKRHYGGFGLGLWIVRYIVETLGGTVRVESATGQGSTFTVDLPLAATAHPPQWTDGAPAEGPT